MKTKHEKYILENIDKKSVRELAQELNIKERRIRRLLQQEGSDRAAGNEAGEKSGPAWPWRRHVFALILILAVGVLAYSNSIHGSFHLDDAHTIVNNSSIRTLDPATVWRGDNSLRFVGFYSFALNYRVNGLEDVRGWHYVNIFLHIICSMFLYAVLNLAVRESNSFSGWLPLIASVLFAAHPLCSEPVNYIQARLVLLYSLFCLSGLTCTMFFFRAYSMKGKVLCALGTAVSLVLGALSKEPGIFLVLGVIGAYLFIFRARRYENRDILRPKIIVIVILAILATVALINHIAPLSNIFRTYYDLEEGLELSYPEYVLTQIKVFWKYVSFLIPRSSVLNVDHQVSIVKTSVTTDILTAIVSLLLMAGGVAAALAARRKHPLPSFLVLWSVIAVLPYMLIPKSKELMVDYKAYLSTMALISLCWCGLEGAVRSAAARFRFAHTNTIPVILAGILTILCITETRARNKIWRTNLSLWQDAANKSPGKSRPNNNLGNSYLVEGKPQEAMIYYKKAIDLNPRYTDAHVNLGSAYSDLGLHDEAIGSYKRAIDINAALPEAHYNLGNAYTAASRYEEAIVSFKRAVELNPYYAKAYYNLGNAYASTGRYEDAIAVYEKAVEIEPNNAGALGNMGSAHRALGRYDRAIESHKRALKIRPNSARTYNNLGNAYRAAGRHEEAITSYKKTIEIDPDNANAYTNLGNVYSALGRNEEAAAAHRKAKELGAGTPQVAPAPFSVPKN